MEIIPNQSDEPLGAGELEKKSLEEVHDVAIRVLGANELAEHWLTHPALALDGMRPLDLLATGDGIQAVKDLLTRMEFGVYM